MHPLPPLRAQAGNEVWESSPAQHGAQSRGKRGERSHPVRSPAHPRDSISPHPISGQQEMAESKVRPWGVPTVGEVQLWGARGAWGAMKAALRSWGSWGLVSMIPGGWGAGKQGWVCPGSREALDWVWPRRPLPSRASRQPKGQHGSAPQPCRVRIWGSARVGLLLCLAPPSSWASEAKTVGAAPHVRPAWKGQDSAQRPHPRCHPASKDQRHPGQLRSLRRVLEADQGRGLHCIFIPISIHHFPHRTPFRPFRSTG